MPITVTEEALRPIAGQQTSIVDAQDFGGNAAIQEQKTGIALQQDGSELQVAATHMQNQQDATAVFNAETELKKRQIDFDTDLNNRRGQNAWGATDDAKKFWNDTTAEIADTMTDGRQKALFNRSASRLAVSHLEQVSNYEGAQRRAAVEDSGKASIAQSVNLAAANAGAWQTRPNVADLQVQSPDKSQWNTRADGSTKGDGFLGVLQRPDGKVSSEISVGVQINGKETDIPLLVPTLTRPEVNKLLAMDPSDPSNVPPAIMDKAIAFATNRVSQGLSPFAQASDKVNDPVSMAKTDIIKRNMVLAQTNGWTPERLDLENTNDLTTLHKAVIQNLIQEAPDKAEAYYQFNKNEIAGTQRDDIEKALKVGVDANAAQTAADTIWTSAGPKKDGQPLQLDVMEEQARKMFPNDANKAKDTVTELRSRGAAFNSSETERTASNVNTIMGAYAQGKSLNDIKKMPEWTALPGAKQAEITDHVTAKVDAAQSHADAVLAHADAADARAQRKRQQDAAGGYLVYSDPNVLSKMSESEVESLLPSLGEEKTYSLLDMKRKLTSPKSIADAKMDANDFNVTAAKFGLKPFDKGANRDEDLADLRSRTDRLIGDAQAANGNKPIGRDAKIKILNDEMARTVTTKGGFFSPDKQTPVIMLKPEDVDNVSMTQQDRTDTSARLRQLHQQRPNDPRFVANEHNLKMLYLRSVSPAGKYADGN